MDQYYGYMVRDWKCLLVLLTLERVTHDGTLDYLTIVVMNIACTYGSMCK